MAKRTVLPSYLSGTERIEITNTFVYEITVYKLYKDRAELVNSKFFSSPKKLNIKKDVKIIRKPDCVISKQIHWIGAPEDYILTNNLKPYNK